MRNSERFNPRTDGERVNMPEKRKAAAAVCLTAAVFFAVLAVTALFSGSASPLTDAAAYPAFSQSREAGGVTVTVSAEAGVLPADSVLYVEQAETDGTVCSGTGVAGSYTFDIKVVGAITGEEYQPADGKTVSVSFSADAIADANLETEIYHVRDDGFTEALSADRDGRTATVRSGGFSFYTIQLTYGSLSYDLEGGSTVALSTVLEALNLKGTVSAARSSDENIISVSADLKITSLSPFHDRTAYLYVTVNGTEYEITVNMLPWWTTDAKYQDDYFVYMFTGNSLNLTLEVVEYKGYGYYGDRIIPVPATVKIDGKTYTVTGIGTAFAGDTHITGITIPSTVTYFKSGAFEGCSGLSSFTVPSSVTSLPDKCFKDCASLSSITVPSSVTSFGEYCFAGCSSLESITVPSSVKTVGYYCFSGCTSLTDIPEMSGVTRYPNGCFKGCTSMLSPSVSTDITYVGWYAFGNIPGITINYLGTKEQWYSVSTIPEYGYSYGMDYNPYNDDNTVNKTVLGQKCAKLKTSDSYWLGLSQIISSDGTTVSVVTVCFEVDPQNNMVLSAEDACSLDCGKFFYYNEGTVGTNMSGDKVRIYQCYDPEHVQTLTIGKNVQLTDTYFAFANCFFNLKTITVEEGSPFHTAADGLLFDKEGKTLLGCVYTHEDPVVVPEGVESIAFSIFYFDKFNNYRGDRITKVYLPNTLTSIEERAFNATWIRNIYFNGTEVEWENVSKDSSWYYGDAITIHYPCTVTFNANGHGTAPDPVSAWTGEPVSNPGNVTATGYTFTGWYTDSSLKNKWNFESDVTGDMILYAGWEINNCTVTYKIENGTWSDGTATDKTETVQEGSSPASVPESMIASSGFTGGAWDTDPSTAVITGATTFTYTFEPIPTYTVTYKVSNGTWSDGTATDKTETVQEGSSPASIPQGMTASSGFTGGAWDTDPSTTVITGATTFTRTEERRARKA